MAAFFLFYPDGTHDIKHSAHSAYEYIAYGDTRRIYVYSLNRNEWRMWGMNRFFNTHESSIPKEIRAKLLLLL